MVEAVATVAVVAIAGLFTLRAFSIALEGMRTSQNLGLACLVAEGKMWEIQQQKAAEPQSSGEETRTMQEKDFDCSWTTQRNDETGLTHIDLQVTWNKGARTERSIDFHSIVHSIEKPEAP